jgi:hypothetical protein
MASREADSINARFPVFEHCGQLWVFHVEFAKGLLVAIPY